MAKIDDLIQQITDEELRNRIQNEVEKLSKQKKFGLVFEEHLPECSPLYDIPVRRGKKVTQKSAKEIKEIFTVVDIQGEKAICIKNEDEEPIEFNIADLVVIAEFGEPIYPYLKPIDSVCNAPDSELWHTLIEADNYHALQLLEYLYSGKVDCIYIDPPYNKPDAKDWKYNNNYVDGNDSYRHSKWLSFMKKRLELAKRLLNPDDSVLIVTIDEKEYLHLGCLLEDMFPEANIQMVSSLISRKGAARFNEFTRVNEFVFFVMFGSYTIHSLDDADYALEGEKVHWQSYRRSSIENIRTSRPRQFYPIYVNVNTNRIEKIGDAIPHDVDRFSVEQVANCVAVFPVRDDGTEMLWGLTPDECRRRLELGYLRAYSYDPNKPQQFIVQYLMSGTIDAIEEGKIVITGYAEDGSIIAENNETRKIMPKSQWSKDAHDARDYGNKYLKKMLGDGRFNFPKSLYAVCDCIRYFLLDKKNALIVDFFAGSGTTLHAVNILNAEDGGNRRCIMVTNNEVSESEEKELRKRNFCPGDYEWERLGIARFVTWERTRCSILGNDINGVPLKGTYGANIDIFEKIEDEKGLYKKTKKAVYPEISKMKMSDGFKANAAFFKLGFLDKDAVARREQLRELMSVLWMKSGCFGECPVVENNPDMIILPKNHFALLNKESSFLDFEEKLLEHPEIETVFIVTDSENAYRRMIAGLSDKKTYQLYRDYLDNFRINTAR